MKVREPPFPSHIEAGASTLGVARAALERAYEHANDRVQFGTEIINHQTVAHDIAEMSAELQAARSLLWTAARAADEAPELSYPFDSMAKVIAADTSVDVCHRSLELFGGSGIMLDEPIQKYFRDAISFLHSDGTQRAHKQKVINELRGIEHWSGQA
jgi:alkylation response protein AidB-like acyl-CoA dehydrogenase